ncbi:MAG: anti-sigma factor [Vicinamibacterales bacterium]
MSRVPAPSCRAHLEQVSRYIDGDLNAAERRAMSRHMERCPCCAEFAESLRRTVAACRSAGRRRLPADVRARARARIEKLMED